MAAVESNDIVWNPLDSTLPRGVGPFDCIIAYAGVTPGPGIDTALNSALANATLEAAHAAGIGRVLVTSSAAIYGIPSKNAPLTERDVTQPVNDYGRSKQAMEEICGPWRARGLEICCLRIGNVAGADMLLLNGQGARGTPLVIDRFADGEGPFRSYVGPATLARITATLAAHPGPLPPCLNVAAPLPIAMVDLARAAGFDWRWQRAPASAIQRITLDVTRLEALYSFTPTDSDPSAMAEQWIRLRDPE